MWPCNRQRLKPVLQKKFFHSNHIFPGYHRFFIALKIIKGILKKAITILHQAVITTASNLQYSSTAREECSNYYIAHLGLQKMFRSTQRLSYLSEYLNASAPCSQICSNLSVTRSRIPWCCCPALHCNKIFIYCLKVETALGLGWHFVGGGVLLQSRRASIDTQKPVPRINDLS